MWTTTGTLQYKAPEMFEGTGYTEQIDTWAVGVIMYEVLAGI
jgi:serine/threonine protein kinase